MCLQLAAEDCIGTTLTPTLAWTTLTCRLDNYGGGDGLSVFPSTMVHWNGAKTKVQLKLTAQRCQLLQEKKSAIAKKDRREIASLVEKGKVETARVKTEGVIGEDIALELLEIMELYSEMLIVCAPPQIMYQEYV